jgi:hypothetical protein
VANRYIQIAEIDQQVYAFDRHGRKRMYTVAAADGQNTKTRAVFSRHRNPSATPEWILAIFGDWHKSCLENNRFTLSGMVDEAVNSSDSIDYSEFLTGYHGQYTGRLG